MIDQQLVVIPVLSQEGVSSGPSTPLSWTNLYSVIFMEHMLYVKSIEKI